MEYLIGLGIAAAGLIVLAVLRALAPRRFGFLDRLFEPPGSPRERQYRYWRWNAGFWVVLTILFLAYTRWPYVALGMAGLALSVVMMGRRRI